MTNWPVRVVKLAASPFEPGLWCGPDGLSLSGQSLFETGDGRFTPRPLSDLQGVLDTIYGEDAGLEAGNYLPGLTSVARLLNHGDLPLAMIGSLMLKLPEVGGDFKQAFDPTQPRDENGRWTQDAESEAKGPPLTDIVPVEAPTAVEGVTAARTLTSTIAELAPEAVGLLGRLAGLLAGPLAIGAGVLIPTNRSNIHSGDLPGAPGLTYRSDEGILTISRLTSDGKVENLYHGFPDADGFYRDDQGEIVGREVGTGVLFDNDYLAELAAPKSDKPPEEASSPAAALLPDVSGDEPRICPPPTLENNAGRSWRTIAYQAQMTGLLPGFDMEYRGVRFDGCDDNTGRMIEAKGLGMEWMLNRPYDKIVISKFYIEIMDQARRQNDAAVDRGDDYYFADERMAEFFEAEFERAGYSNIKVHHVEAVVKKFEDYTAWAEQLYRALGPVRKASPSYTEPYDHRGGIL